MAIVASSDEEALAWGQEVSERFIAHLYGDPWISWKQGDYASWVEPVKERSLDDLRK